MKGKIVLVFIALHFASPALCQQATPTPTVPAARIGTVPTARPSGPDDPNKLPVDLARAALMAQGGEIYRRLKNLILVGVADVYLPNSTQSLRVKFVIVTEGQKYRLDVDAAPVLALSQIYDGQRAYSSIRGFTVPPPDRFGLPLLLKYDQAGYVVSALPSGKGQPGFRITDPEGNSTDYTVEASSGRVMRYEVSYHKLKFAVVHKVLKEYKGVLIPYAFAQKFDTPQGSFFGDFKVTEVKVNQKLAADMFAIP
jgi:hypothetical protein